MDMSTSSSSMDTTMSMPTSTSTGMTMATSGASMDNMTMGGCKISMTWNWYTVGACFIAKTWQVTSAGMFAGSCIGVIFLVISLEFLRRIQREYDAFIRRQDQRSAMAATAAGTQVASSSASSEQGSKSETNAKSANVGTRLMSSFVSSSAPQARRSRSILLKRQFIRSLIHMVQFAVAYFIMLLAMYYNGYIIICIIIGAFLGSFIFSWDQMLDKSREEPADVTGCCG